MQGTSSANDVAPVKPGTSAVDARPLEGLRRRRPALGRAEQLDEALARRVVVGRASPGRSGSAWTARSCRPRAPPARSTCRWKRSAGAAAYGTGSTPRTVNSGSGARRAGGGLDAHAAARLAQRAKNPATRLVDRRAAGDALPALLDQPDEPVALVDRHDRVAARVAEAVDDQRLRVGLEALEHRVARDERVPGGRASARTRSRRPGSGTARRPRPPRWSA